MSDHPSMEEVARLAGHRMPNDQGEQRCQAVGGNAEGKVPTSAPVCATAAGEESASPALPGWTIAVAVSFIQDLETEAKAFGYHCGLTGSVLFHGASDDDLDVILYPHRSGETKPPEEILRILGLSGEKCEHEYDAKIVFKCKTERGVVDVFFLT